jgi:hypothetical protein
VGCNRIRRKLHQRAFKHLFFFGSCHVFPLG